MSGAGKAQGTSMERGGLLDEAPSLLDEAPSGSVSNACCCPARPAVRVVMPPGPARRHTTELLLCGHHYRVSKTALTKVGAIVRELPDTPEDVASWIGHQVPVTRAASPSPRTR
jgi:hypothetical protein